VCSFFWRQREDGKKDAILSYRDLLSNSIEEGVPMRCVTEPAEVQTSLRDFVKTFAMLFRRITGIPVSPSSRSIRGKVPHKDAGLPLVATVPHQKTCHAGGGE